MLHDAPQPPWPGWSLDEIASHLDGECEWLLANGALPGFDPSSPGCEVDVLRAQL